MYITVLLRWPDEVSSWRIALQHTAARHRRSPGPEKPTEASGRSVKPRGPSTILAPEGLTQANDTR